MGDTGRLLRSTFEARRIQLPARVTSIPLDADGKTLGYVLAEISGQTGVKVRIGPSDNYYPGDWIAAEQVGGGAGAQYVAAGFVAGTRPQSGAWEITSQITIGSETFDPGDVVYGNPYDSHWWYDYSVGRWNVRQANATRGALGPLADTYDYALGSAALGFVFGDYTDTWIAGDDVNGFRIFSGAVQRVALNTDGSGWFVAPDTIAWDTAGNLTLAGNFRALALHIGQQHGPMIRGGEVIELDDQGAPITEVTTRYGLRIYDTSGLPRIALLTGTLDEPNSVAALFGSESDASYLHYDAHGLRLKGELTASSGAIGGWTITADQLRSRWSALVLDSDGLLLANNEVGIHGADPSGLRVWAGASYDYRASAPFRVYNDGRVYATKVLALEAENAVSGSGVITVANTGSGVAAYGLMVTAAGSYAVYVNGPDGGLEVVGATLPALKGATSGPYPTVDVTSDQSYAVQAQATGAAGALRAIGGTYAIKMEAAPMHAGAQNIEAVNYLYAQRLYLGDTAHYLYLSGDSLYWHNGTTNILIA